MGRVESQPAACSNRHRASLASGQMLAWKVLVRAHPSVNLQERQAYVLGAGDAHLEAQEWSFDLASLWTDHCFGVIATWL